MSKSNQPGCSKGTRNREEEIYDPHSTSSQLKSESSFCYQGFQALVASGAPDSRLLITHQHREFFPSSVNVAAANCRPFSHLGQLKSQLVAPFEFPHRILMDRKQ
ncbi:hypothetical protein ECG_08864 [Echinococcus granulosus]|nr:hypothetical protein ECG_08864 [Echinococcus granulosus]